MARIFIPSGTDKKTRIALQRFASALDKDKSLEFDSITLANLTANTLIYVNSNKTLTSFTSATNGQLLIGNTGNVPVLATLTGTSNEISITNGAGSITIGLANIVDLGKSI